MLESYIAAGWPNNQHGYKSGRGVHTIWNQVFVSVIKAKNIFEFDLTGFFNNVNVEAVGKTLHKFNVPKYVISCLILIGSGDIENIPIEKELYLLKTTVPEEAGWLEAWKKYEFIHKYRKGYRHKCLAQGSPLSPLLSVLTLIVLDELEEHNIKYIMYCDDGLLYSDKLNDFSTIAQSILDKHNIGAYFAMSKSKWVKRNNEWLSVLKLVGLEYNPWTDTLSASTRNGATLKLDVCAIGLFTDVEPVIKPWLLNKDDFIDDRWDYWDVNNKKLFWNYERLFLEKGRAHESVMTDMDNLAKTTYHIMKTRLSLFDPFRLSDELSKGDSQSFIHFLTPLVLLKKIGKESYYELVKRYETDHGCDFPYNLLHKNAEVKAEFWMDKNLSAEEMAIITEEKSNFWKKETTVDPNKAEDKLNIDIDNTKDLLQTLVWFSDLPSVPDVLTSRFENGQCKLGEWFKTTLEELDINLLPSDVAKLIKDKSSRFGYTKVNWRNLYMDPAFATFIARLFQNSFSSDVVKQNFKLEHDHEKENIVRLIKRYLGKQRLNEILENGLTIFNATSLSSNLLLHISDEWVKACKSVKKFQTPAYLRVYKELITKIANRRSDVDIFGAYIKNTYHTTAWRSKTLESELATPSFWTRKGKYRKLNTEDIKLLYQYPLAPQTLYLTDKHIATRKHLENKYKNYKPLSIETISRSSISIQSLYTQLWDKDIPRMPRIERTRWDTLETKKRILVKDSPFFHLRKYKNIRMPY
jgi:hypothetical protein